MRIAFFTYIIFSSIYTFGQKIKNQYIELVKNTQTELAQLNTSVVNFQTVLRNIITTENELVQLTNDISNQKELINYQYSRLEKINENQEFAERQKIQIKSIEFNQDAFNKEHGLIKPINFNLLNSPFKNYKDTDMDNISKKEQNEMGKTRIHELESFRKEIQENIQNAAFNIELYSAKKKQLDECIQGNKTIYLDSKQYLEALNTKFNVLQEEYLRKGKNSFPAIYQEIFEENFATIGGESTQYSDLNSTTNSNNSEPPAKVESKKNETYTFVDEQAHFPGGAEAFRAFIQKNLKYPSDARDLGIEGTCYLQCVILANGQITEVSILKGVPDCKPCDEEALRLMKIMPNFIPAKLNGENVNCNFRQPIKFKL